MRRLKRERKDDLISSLPDCLIQHILSFLPSTRDAIRTGVLSKRWLYQWTHVPVLIFKFHSGMCFENLSNSIDNALSLYNCSKINKFVFNLKNCFSSKYCTWIRFALERDVKELIVEQDYQCLELPHFLFNNAFLVKLKTVSCKFMPEIMGNVHWSSLKALSIGYTLHAMLPNQAIEKILSGCPLIEYLELRICFDFDRLVIASKSLKTFRLFDSGYPAIEITCPNLEKLELLGATWFSCLEFKGLPPSVSVTLDFQNKPYSFYIPERELKWVKELLLQVQNVQSLKLGPQFLKVLSFAAPEDKSSRMLNIKSLTLMDPFLGKRQPALAMLLLRCSLLEKLVIQLNGRINPQLEGFVKIGNETWDLDGSIFDCLVSHLKNVEIVGFHHISGNDSCNDVLKFVEFLLKNARMLEYMVLLEAPGDGMIFGHRVCEKLSCIQKASPHAIIKVASLSKVGLHSDSDWDKFVC